MLWSLLSPQLSFSLSSPEVPPSPELVKRVRDLYHKRLPDVRFLIPVLNGLEKVGKEERAGGQGSATSMVKDYSSTSCSGAGLQPPQSQWWVGECVSVYIPLYLTYGKYPRLCP